jgi:subtilisin family serine protease
MASFNWNQLIHGIPDAWRNTGGAGVRIALIDAGADLTHPALAHLAGSKRYDVTRQGFDAKATDLPAADDVTEPTGIAHGTACLSVLAAKNEIADGVSGIAPEAEVIIIKATDAGGTSSNTHFLKALQVALREKADIISVNYVPTGKFGFQQPLIKEIFGTIATEKTALCVALDNTDLFFELNDLRYPANQSAAIAVGVATPSLLASRQLGEQFNSSVFSIFPFLDTRFCGPNGSWKNEKASSSTVNACFSGLIALLLAHWKNTEGSDYRRRDKTELLAALSEVLAPFDTFGEAVLSSDYRFFTPHQPMSA